MTTKIFESELSAFLSAAKKETVMTWRRKRSSNELQKFVGRRMSIVDDRIASIEDSVF